MLCVKQIASGKLLCREPGPMLSGNLEGLECGGCWEGNSRGRRYVYIYMCIHMCIYIHI